MDVNVRNNLYFDYTDTIRRIMRRNSRLLYALRLEKEDVFQELSIVALTAIESFDPSRSDCMEAYIWMELQFAVLDMKRYQSPGGLTDLEGARPTIYSAEYSLELGHPLNAPENNGRDVDRRLNRALSRLEPAEREAVILYLEGNKLKRKKEKSAFASALEKLKIYYTAAQMALA